jgi:L-ascorbate metabolism protein UlaG (beta-lactamase superfamily)
MNTTSPIIVLFFTLILSAAMFAEAPASNPATAPAANPATESTSAGPLVLNPLNHSALRFEFKGKQYYLDPAGKADWANLPKADAILITHEHFDHLDPALIEKIKKPDTLILINRASAAKLPGAKVIEPGQSTDLLDIKVEAIPAYNLSDDRLKFHPKDRKDNGYVLTFGDKRVYVAGDTEGTPEMKAMKNIDIAFLPINLPYTMTPEQAVDAAKAFRPRILYPYHQGTSDPEKVRTLLESEPGIEVRVLPLP